MQISETPYKLLILMQIEPVSEPPLTDYLDAHEVLPRRNFTIGLTITNIGTDVFVGGKLTSLRTTWGEQIVTDMLTRANPVIPSLEPEKTLQIFKFPTRAEAEGVAWIMLQMIANDNRHIEYYQKREVRHPQNEWMNHFYVLSKSEILLIKILDAISRKV